MLSGLYHELSNFTAIRHQLAFLRVRQSLQRYNLPMFEKYFAFTVVPINAQELILQSNLTL